MDQATADKLRQEHYQQQDKERLERVIAQHAVVAGADEDTKRGRRILADMMVVQLRRLLGAEFPEQAPEAVLVVHWDDCNFSCDQFWFHFRDRTLIRQHRTGDGHARKISGMLRRAMTRAKQQKEFAEHARYRFSWELAEAPQVEEPAGGITRGRCYETASWIYILNIQGS